MKGRLVQLVMLVMMGLAWGQPASAQVKEVHFNDLQSYFEKQNDTLYVINFWATWCGPCVEELPYFNKLSRELADRPVAVLLVSLDFASNLDQKVIPFVKNRDLEPRVLFLHQPSGHQWMNKVSTKWSGAIPATYIVKNDRAEAGFYERSFDDYQALLQVVQSHL